jgi:hypothetical protein
MIPHFLRRRALFRRGAPISRCCSGYDEPYAVLRSGSSERTDTVANRAGGGPTRSRCVPLLPPPITATVVVSRRLRMAVLC